MKLIKKDFRFYKGGDTVPTQIAFFGSAAMVEQVQEYTKDRTDIILIPFIYNKPEEVVKEIEKARYCDVMLFSGLLPYYFAQEILRSYKKPSLYIPINEYMLSISLFQLLYHEGFSLERISLDIPDRSILLQCLHDVHLQHDLMWLIDYPFIFDKNTSSNFSTSKIMAYHEQLHQQGKVDITLTSIHAVYDGMQAKGLPCRKLIDPKKNVMEAIEEAIVQSNIYLTRQSQMAVGYILLESEKIEESILNKIAANLDAELESSTPYRKNGVCMFHSTRGRMEQATNNFQEFPFSQLEVPIKLGIGFGLTIDEAKRNGKIALTHTERYDSTKIAFIVTEDEMIIGPLGTKENKAYQLNSYDKTIQERAKKAGVSVAKLNQFLSFVESLPKNQFTTEDLANNFAVTRRSAERLLKKLIAQKLVYKIGEEQLYQYGRPRAIYTFLVK